MTAPTDWRAQRYAAKSPAWLAGWDAFNRGDCPPTPDTPHDEEYVIGYWASSDDYNTARDRAREDRQHYPLFPMSALERNRP